MENREFDQLSADIREYTLRFQEAMLHFFRDSIIRRIYGSGNDLQKVLDEYIIKIQSLVFLMKI